MEISTLKRAVSEAKRFISLANKVKTTKSSYLGVVIESPSKESSALKRASMDLTRVLTDLRQNR